MSSFRTNRHTYIDILRLIASFFVCYNHTFAYHLFLEQAADGSLLSWANIGMSSVVAINIPLFFMISGVLLLPKKESYSVLLQKRVSRILVLIAAISAITYLLIPAESPSVRDFICQTLQGSVAITHWYLFAYLGLVLMLPLLRHTVQEMTRQDLIFLVVLRTLFRPILTILNFWLNHWGFDGIQISSHLQFPLAIIDCFFCPIVGYYLAHKYHTADINRKQLWGWAGLFFGSCIVASLMTYAEGIYDCFTQNFIGEFGYSAAMAVFVLTRCFSERIPISDRMAHFLSGAGSVVIGIYLLEPIVSHYLQSPFFRHIPWHPIPLTFFSILWCFVCMTIGGTATWLLRKIPGVKKYL